MKAMVQRGYGAPSTLRLEEVPTPTPSDGQVLVRVCASSVNFGNLALVRGKPFIVRLMAGGVRKPKHHVPGGDVAGVVEAVGSNVSRFQPGDQVYGDLSWCGFGAYAEYVIVPAEQLAPKPANLTFEQAAAAPQAALVALQGLRDKGGIGPGQNVLIIGASGGNGTFAVQIAKAFGAKVTGVCSSRNVEMVRSIGADHVIDYTQQDFAKSGREYDLILATAGYRSISDYRRALSPQGTYVMTGGAMAQVYQAMLLGPLLSRAGGKRLTNLDLQQSHSDLLFMKELFESSAVVPVIDRQYPLDGVPQALEYYGQGHARGKVVITMDDHR